MEKAKILVVEDEKITVARIKRTLAKLGYEVSSDVPSGEEAILRIEEEKPDLVLMDIRLQGEMDGIEAAAKIRSQFKIPVIYLSSFSEEQLLHRAKLTEPYACIIKPFKEKELHSNIEIALFKHRSEEQLKEAYRLLQKTFKGTIKAMSTMAEINDPFLSGHQQRAAQLARAIAKEMGLNPGRVEGTHLAGLIHDIGLISVPFELINKEVRSEEEQALYNAHPGVGYNLLEPVYFHWPIPQIVLQHHERMNGSGYPQGLMGEKIILEARILAVADMVVTKTCHRPYRRAFDIDVALEEISKSKGILYDEEVVSACLRLFDEKRYPLENLT